MGVCVLEGEIEKQRERERGGTRRARRLIFPQEIEREREREEKKKEEWSLSDGIGNHWTPTRIRLEMRVADVRGHQY